MDYKQLYEKLLAEYNLLRDENEQLRSLLHLKKRDYCAVPEMSGKTVSMQSSSEEKVALFRSLFKGREDVYARRWQNNKTGKSGYSPVCANEWDYVLCNKRAHKCSECPDKKYVPLTDSVIETHLKGVSATCSDVIGIYPLLEGDVCYFLVIDFDNEGWQDDVTAVRSICKEKDICACVERSRSGNGGHVWFFFEEKISAALARKFGSLLLTLAMERRHEIKFSSYDRLFPNQDFIPNSGLGNLIALPLQGRARKEGNSLFVDERFAPYDDQWAFLDNLEKIKTAQIDKLLNECKAETGELAVDNQDGDTVKAIRGLTAFDFPATVRVTFSNMLHIDKRGISECGLNKIKRLAAFHNPDFYKAQKMRLPVYNKPRIIATYEETENCILLPRGCKNSLDELLKEFGVNVNYVDNRNAGMSIDVRFNGQLRNEQIPAFNALIAHTTGVLCATTAFGKTVIGAKLIAERKVNTLILVHSAALLNQWKQALSKFLILDNELPVQPQRRGRKKEISQIGQLGATKSNLNGFVDIAIMQSLVSSGEAKKLVKDYGLVIVDECHHVPAVSFEAVMKAVAAKYVYGLTATPQRQDGRQKIIYFQCGDIRYTVDAKEQAKLSGFEHVVVPKFTFFRMPLGVGKFTIQKVFEKISESYTRNSLIVNDVLKAVNDGRNILVLTERRSHAELLEREINAAGIKTFLLIGTESAKLKREKLSQITKRENDEQFVIVATGKYVGEGFDSERLDTLFLTMPISWKGKLAQYVGRLHRQYSGKKNVIVYDYVDVNLGMLENMYRKRIVGYRSLGYDIKVEESGKRTGILFDKFNYQPIFKEDILSAKKSILIACPKLKSGAVEKFISHMELLADKPETAVITLGREENGDCVKKLIEAGIDVKIKDELNSNFAIIDGLLIWYGSISYLSYGLTDDTALRFESFDTAKELNKLTI